jgi:protein-arginine deiminase
MHLAIALAVLLWSGPDIDLDGDTDRDGVISGSQAEEDLEAKNSVLVINNCDRDDPGAPAAGPRLSDNLDEVINGAKDREDMEPLIIRKLAKPAAGRLSLRLKAQSQDGIDEKSRVRIFKDDGTRIIGPGTSTTYRLTDAEQLALTTAELKLLVEGLAFATSVKLSVYLDETEQDFLILEAAPFLLLPHTQPVEENFVVKTDTYSPTESALYVDRFRTACQTAGVGFTKLETDDDLWIEDQVSWGYSQTPRVRMPVALQLYRFNKLQAAVQTFLKPDVGYATAFDYGSGPTTALEKARNSPNLGGNIEVTPPTKKYPFGRIYYGSIPSQDAPENPGTPRAIDGRFKSFFERQKVQCPINLNTDWLFAGHVDEIITFLPKPDGHSVLLLASPTLALRIASQLGDATTLPERYQLFTGATTVSDLLHLGQSYTALVEYNRTVDLRIFGADHANPDSNSTKGQLKRALDLDEADIFEVPVLYVYYLADNGVFGAIAVTPNQVNLNSMSLYSLLPEPFLDAFKAPVQSLLCGLGQKPLWIDNWYVYHVAAGEVHCGSNSRRQPFSRKWWEPSSASP